MKKLLLLIAFVAVAGVSYYVGNQNGMRKSALMKPDEMSDDTMDIEESMLISASFRCDDESSFIADFSAPMDEVTISAEGESNMFPLVASTNGKLYENAAWSFLFRGETATVTDKMMNKSLTCNPPFDNENAPMNFGD